MEKLLIQFQTKAHNCNTKTKEGRARKGAYVDCAIMLQEFIETYQQPVLHQKNARDMMNLNLSCAREKKFKFYDH